jgi:hypothetical protein
LIEQGQPSFERSNRCIRERAYGAGVTLSHVAPCINLSNMQRAFPFRTERKRAPLTGPMGEDSRHVADPITHAWRGNHGRDYPQQACIPRRGGRGCTDDGRAACVLVAVWLGGGDCRSPAATPVARLPAVRRGCMGCMFGCRASGVLAGEAVFEPELAGEFRDVAVLVC